MEIIQYTDAHIDFRTRLRAFMERELVPNIDQWEADHVVSRDIWRKMGQEGFLCPTLPQEYGGLGGDFRYSVIGIEEISRTNSGGLAAPLHSDIVVPYIMSFGSDDQKKKYLPGAAAGEIVTAVAMTEPGAGSDVAGMEATAVEDGDEIILNGTKTFISNGVLCDLVVVAAKDPLAENSHQAISLYIVEDGTPGFKKGTQLEKMGLYSQDTAELFFSDCRIPAENRLGDKGMGFFMLMDKLQQERLVCVIMGVAAAEFMLAWTTNYCKTTIQAGRPLSRSQAVQFALVEMATEVKLGRTFADKLVADHVEGENVIIETSMGKYWCTELGKRVADRCLDLIGEPGGLEQCPLTRGFRDVRVMSIFAGTNEIMKGIAAKFMGM
ncbi:MAG: acyl-CoA dehydrogenase family protein [Desulfobacterales bacterium]|nr:acyl-CoA dehydrogenase family protein [Desulfobacterales bacterium]